MKKPFLDRDIRNNFPAINNSLTRLYSSGSVELQMGKYVTEQDLISKAERNVRVDACYKHFVTIKDIFQELICCQLDLNKLKAKKENENKRHRQLVAISIASFVVAIISIAVAIAT